MMEESGMENAAVVPIQIETDAREMRSALEVSDAYFSSRCRPF